MADSSTAARPFLKWVGGKTALLPEILSRLPKKIGTYYEPFIGGGAVFFALAAEKRFESVEIGDANIELVHTYECVSRHVDDVIVLLRKHKRDHCETHYYRVRGFDSTELTSAGRAARLIYLNRTCFNGLYRVNKKGWFNVPFGDYSNPLICDEENLRAVSRVLHGVISHRGDFAETVASAAKGDVVYFDPPYVPLSETSNFTAYAKGGFGLEERRRLRDVARALVRKGVHVLLSNSSSPLVWDLYSKGGFKIEEVQAPRRVNSKGDKRGNVTELLITGVR